MRNVLTPNQIISDAPLNFNNLLHKINTLFGKCGNAYGNDDGRTAFFANSFQLNLWLLAQFDSLLEVFAPNSDRVSRYCQLSSKNARQFLLQYDTINRASYCTTAMFEVEHFLQSIAKELNMNSDVPYGKLIAELKKPLGLSNYQCDILKLPAYTRNTLHNNGYHSKPDFQVTVGIKTFKFKKCKQVRFAGWNNLYIMFDELLDVLEVITESAPVKMLTQIPHTSMTYHGTP